MTENANASDAASRRHAPILLQGPLLAAVFSFWLYFVAAFYVKGYLRFFNADAAWFAPSAFQLIAFSAVPMALASAMLCAWMYLMHGIATYFPQEIPPSTPSKSKAFSKDRWVEFKQEISTAYRNLRRSGRITFHVLWGIVYFCFIAGSAAAFIPVRVGVHSRSAKPKPRPEGG
jgi:hypothetical protein